MQLYQLVEHFWAMMAAVNSAYVSAMESVTRDLLGNLTLNQVMKIDSDKTQPGGVGSPTCKKRRASRR